MPAVDSFQHLSRVSSLTRAEAVTPHNTNELTNVSRAIYVGTGGNVVVVMQGGAEVTLAGVEASTWLPIRIKKVKLTGTTASNIVAFS